MRNQRVNQRHNEALGDFGLVVLLTALFGTGASTVSPLAYAHHSMDRFDSEQTVTVTGRVKRVEWANPHVYIYIDQLTEGGDTVEWEIEGFPPAIMRRLGWSRETLEVNDVLTIAGNPHKSDDNKSMFPSTMERSDSKLFSMMEAIPKMTQSGTSEEFVANSIAGTWVTILDPEIMQRGMKPKSLGVTAEGEAVIDNFDEDTMHPGINCIANASPAFMTIPDIKQVQVFEDRIVIGAEFDNAYRTIYLNQDSHAGAEPSVQGHSIGHWEDDTLVIDTTHFAPHAMGIAGFLASGPQKHLVERISLNEDGKSLTYEWELSDPQYLLNTTIGKVTWAYRPDLEFSPEECDLENARRFLE